MEGRSPYTPLYVVISDAIRGQIVSGELAPSSRLPSERELCREWNCSTITARHAINTLRDEGLIRTVRGSGAFVAPQPERIPITIGPLRRDCPRSQPPHHQAAGRRASRLHIERLSSETVAITAGVAERLGTSPGVLVTESVHRATLQGETVSAIHIWELPTTTGSAESDQRHDDPFEESATVRRFDSAGHGVDAATHSVCVRMPEPTEVHGFKIPAGVPVVQIWRTLHAGARNIQAAKIIYRADRYEFTFTGPVERNTG